jgi:hypothetical protein
VPEGVALVRRASALPDDGDPGERLALEAELAAIGPTSALFDPAALVRAELLVRSGEPERAAEALAILDRQIARADQLEIQLLRARAAGAAGRTDAAWVALDDLAQRMRPVARSRRIAADALSIADSLPAHPLEPEVRAILLRAAR